MARLTTEEFIEQCKKTHGDKYDYSKVEYKGYNVKVEIICKEHGSFWQLPNNHRRGQGCPVCAKPLQNPFRTVEEFIKKARAIHGDKYDYSKVTNPRSGSKVCIICPIHGEFWQFTNNHLQDCGCPKCSEHRSIDTEYFISKSREIHGDRYNYEKSNYINARTPITITCPIHGDFSQNPQFHMKGGGCPRCSAPRGEVLCENILKKYNIPYKAQFKLINEFFEGSKLFIDFFVKYNDKQYFIEYNGRQHYEPIDFFGGEEAFNKQCHRDKMLRDFCELHKDKVSLLEIPYHCNNVENTILEFLNFEKKEVFNDYERLRWRKNLTFMQA